MGWLPEGRDDREASRSAEAHGVEAQPLSSFCLTTPKRHGLVLGYAGYDADEIREAWRGGLALRASCGPGARGRAIAERPCD